MRKQLGFTLLELLVTLAILAIVAALAVPSFKSSVNQSQVTSTSNEIFGLLRYARAHALQSRETIVVTTLGNDGNPGSTGNTGLVAWVEKSSPSNTSFNSATDQEIRRIRHEGNLTFNIAPAVSAIVFSGDGFVSNTTAGVSLTICSDNGQIDANTIEILKSGIMTLSKKGSC